MARKLRDEGTYLDGRIVSNPPNYFIGAAAAPFASILEYQAICTEKKIGAGAQFFQTNLIFDVDRFEEYLEALDKRNLLNRLHLLAGITLIPSIKAANYMANLPGVHIPDSIHKRLSETKHAKEEGFQICLEIMDRLQSMPGV